MPVVPATGAHKQEDQSPDQPKQKHDPIGKNN
jgi:hypothetical protein